MDRTITGPPIVAPTLSLKTPEIVDIPDIQVISDVDFLRFIDSGFYVVINTPLVKNSRRALFGINLDGYIPPYNTADTSTSRIYKNFSPVQPTPDGLAAINIFQEMIQLPQMMLMCSHRKLRGSVNVGLRITSNTAQSGNLSVSQASGLMRYYYTNTQQYAGVRFLNSSYNGTDYASNNFTLIDVSLNRNVSISTTKREPVQYLDMAQKLYFFGANQQPVSTLNTAKDYNVKSSQFLEDWLLFSLLTGLPNDASNQITVRIFFDYSTVEFETPMFPIIPTVPTNPTKQILAWSTTFNGIANPAKNSYVFLPGSSFAEESESEYLERAKLEIVDLGDE